MTEPPPVIVVAGPTAAGKTSFALELAERIGGEIVGADSRQVYRGFDIGTAKPTPEDLARVPHHLVGIADPGEVFSAARFASLAAEVIRQLDGAGKRAIVVGGTGLYVRALRQGLFPSPPADEPLRSRLRERVSREGSARLHGELARVDPEAAARIHPNDSVRIVRALEVHQRTGTPISEHQRSRTIAPLPGRRFAGFLLKRDMAELERLIARRVEVMIAAGWPEEVRRLIAAGHGRDCPGMESLGYRTMARAAEGEMGLAEARDAIVRETRRYAKRQLTWFAAERWMEAIDLTGLDAAGVAAVAARVAEELR